MSIDRDKPGCLGQFLALFLGRKEPSGGQRLPFQRVNALLTPAERSFFGVLQQALVGRAVLVALKVRLADLVSVEQGVEKRQGWLNKTTGKHVDFVICRRDTTEPILAIELDDKSHARAGRVARDEFLDACLDAAGIPLLRVPAARGYSVAELQAAVASRIDRQSAS